MRAREETIGVLYVDSQSLLTDFSDSNLRLFKALSCLLASAIEHSQLLRAKQDLVVAKQGGLEGCYGKDSGSVERPGSGADQATWRNCECSAP